MRFDSLRHNIETEFKCLVTKIQYDRLYSLYIDKLINKQHTNIYYSDSQGRINELRAVLRNRVDESGNTLTFKIEKEAALHEYEKDNGDLYDTEILALLAEYQIFPPFIKQGEMTTYRRLVELPAADLCLDENHYNGLIDYEIEYELREATGDLAAFVALLKNADIEYQANPLSKYRRFLRSL